MARWPLLLLTVALLGLVQPSRAETRELPPAPTDWVTDGVGFLTEAGRASLDRRLASYAAESGNQVIVWIGESTGDVPLEDFTVKAFERWKVGRKGIDNGIVLFVFATDRKVRIEVGYGLEDKVPDATASRIIRETIVPLMRAGDHDGAVTAGVEAIVARLGGNLPPDSTVPRAQPLAHVSLLQAILLAIGLVAVIAFLATHPSLAAFLLMSIFSGGRGGGGFGGGGGGFSGGGGRSGGGGASGSW